MNNSTAEANLCALNSNSATCGNREFNSAEQSHLSLVTIVALSLMHISSCVLGVLGNSLVLLAIARNSYFRSVSDFFIFSLSTADLLVTAVYVPMLMFYCIFYKDFGVNAVYHRIMTFVGILTWIASLTSIAGVTADRIVAIRWPLRYPSLLPKRLAAASVFLTWLISTGISTTNIFVNIHLFLRLYYMALLLVTIILYSYILKVANTHRKMILTARDMNRRGEAKQNANNKWIKGQSLKLILKERKAAKIFAIILGVSVITWAPFLIYLFSAPKSSRWFLEGFFVVATISLLNSSINSYIYCARSRRYRHMV